MLRFKQTQVSYDDRVVLDDFSVEINQGEIVALVGESGSGKTTAIRAAMGLLPVGGAITAGDILLNKSSLLTMDGQQRLDLMGVQLSMIFQDSGAMLNPVRSIGSQFVEFIRTHEKKISKKDAYEKAKQQLLKTSLPHPDTIMKSTPDELSGGMRQRVGIAMAMTYTPQILFADEPTSALDVTIQAQIVKQLKDLRKIYGTSIILVTHNLAVAAYLADRIIVMQNGKIVEQGNSQDILKNPKMTYTKQLVDSVPDIKKTYCEA